MATPTKERRDRFMRAAIGCFARYGYRRTSMDVIAQAADVSRPALYQYYRGKEEIFRAAVQWGLDDLAERAELAARMPGDTTDRLLAVLGIVVRMHDSRTDGDGRFRAELIDETYERANDLWLGFEERLLTVLRSLLGDRPESAGMTINDVADVLLYGTKGLALRTGDTGRRADLLQHFVTLTVGGLDHHTSMTT